MNGASSSASRWVERASLIDAKGTVRGVEFSPQQFGLKLVSALPWGLPIRGTCLRSQRCLLTLFHVQATISSDNHLRIYECLEQPSLATLQLSEETDVLALPSTSPGGRHSQPQTVTQATPTQISSTLDGASVSLAAHVAAQQQQQNQMPNRPGLGTREVFHLCLLDNVHY